MPQRLIIRSTERLVQFAFEPNLKQNPVTAFVCKDECVCVYFNCRLETEDIWTKFMNMLRFMALLM